MLDEIARTVRSQLYERVTSPLSGVFVLSWGLWNYQLLLVLFSGMNAPEKISYIHNTLYPDLWPSLWKAVFFPLLTTVALIFIYPAPARYVYEHARKQQRKLKEIRQRIDDETPLTKEEAREIRRTSLDQSSEYEREIARQASEISRLKQELAPPQATNASTTITTASKVQGPATQGRPGIAVRPNDRAFPRSYEHTRLLLTGSQLMDHQIKDFVQTDKTFEGKKFLILTDEKNVILTLMPEGLSGQGKHFEYAYDSSGNKPVYSEIDRVKSQIKADITDANEPKV